VSFIWQGNILQLISILTLQAWQTAWPASGGSSACLASVGTITYADLGLVHIGKEGDQDPVPDGKYGAVIGIPLLDDH
jgi:hypothetical protein